MGNPRPGSLDVQGPCPDAESTLKGEHTQKSPRTELKLDLLMFAIESCLKINEIPSSTNVYSAVFAVLYL